MFKCSENGGRIRIPQLRLLALKSTVVTVHSQPLLNLKKSVLPTQWNGVFYTIPRKQNKKNIGNFSETITNCFYDDGQAVRVFRKVGTGFICYLDKFHIQR